MAGQLPPDVLEDLMLVEAVNAPDGVIPGGLDNVRDDDENINFDRWEGPLPPLDAAVFENEAEGEGVHDQLEDENEEEEDISVSETTYVKFRDLSEMTFCRFEAYAPCDQKYHRAIHVLGQEYSERGVIVRRRRTAR